MLSLISAFHQSFQHFTKVWSVQQLCIFRAEKFDFANQPKHFPAARFCVWSRRITTIGSLGNRCNAVRRIGSLRPVLDTYLTPKQRKNLPPGGLVPILGLCGPNCNAGVY